jgi:cytochrome c peroxidase
VVNSAYNTSQFWDGRAETLEAQALGPLINPIEMGNPDHYAVVDRLKQIAGYRELMNLSFGTEDFTITEVAKAIATFERTVLSGNSAFDRYQAGDKGALTEQQVRGMELFFGKANCSRCHGGPLFTDGRFRNIGIGTDRSVQDAGRSDITMDARDWGMFKTPGLRDIGATTPYMHDGSLKTLEEVVELYVKGGIPNANLNPRMRPIALNVDETKSLVAFLRALSGDGWRCISAPEKLPE